MAACKHPVRYYRMAPLGLSASRNAGLRLATVDIVAMTDDDCVPAPGWLAAVHETLRHAGTAAVTGRILPLGPESPGLYAVSSRPGLEAAVFTRKAPPWRAASGGNFAVRRACWESMGGFDERLGAGSPGRAGEDMDFAYRMLRRGQAIRYEPAVLIFHERQELARRTATRWSYGFGIGGFCGKWIRRKDGYAARLLGSWLAWRGREMGGALVRGQAQQARERRLMLAGTLAGLAYGLRLGGHRWD